MITEEDRDRAHRRAGGHPQTQYTDYFLVVWDIARFVRERDIFFTVRGSAAASLALYCLGVTDVNPMTYGLVFERFLHLERRELPTSTWTSRTTGGRRSSTTSSPSTAETT